MKKLTLLAVAVFLCVCGEALAKRQKKGPKEKDMAAYLMVYHKDADHGLHMAIFSFSTSNLSQYQLTLFFR